MLERSRRTHRWLWPVVLVLLLAALLRLLELGTQSLWVDELSSWKSASAPTLAEVIRTLPGPWPPAHFFVLHAIIRLAGDSEFVMRFPSAMAGVLTVAAVYVLGRRLCSHREGLLGAALTAVMWMTVHYSQEVRAYAMLVLFAALSTYFWLRMLRQLDREPPHLSPGVLAGYVITSSLGMYNHYFGLLFFALQGVGAVLYLFPRRGILKLLLPYGLTLLTYLPWLPALWAQYVAAPQSPSWANQPEDPITDLIANFLWFNGFAFNKSPVVLALVGALLAAYVITLAIPVIKSRSLKGVRISLLTPDVLLMLWWVFPFFLVHTVAFFAERSLVVARYFMISLPAAYLMIARAILKLAGRPVRQLAASLAVIALLVGHLVLGLEFYTAPRSAQIREAVAFVLDHDPRYLDDSLITALAFYAAPKSSTPLPNYYFDHAGSTRHVDAPGGRVTDIEPLRERVQAEQPRYIWFILTHGTPDPEFMAFLESNYTLLENRAFHKTEVWLFENKPPDRTGEPGG